MILNHRCHSLTLLAATLLGGLLGCTEHDSSEPIEIERLTPSDGRLHLTEEARESVGIVVSRVTVQEAQATLDTTGWLVVPPSHHVTVKAAATGFIAERATETIPGLGSRITVGQQLAVLEVFLSPQEKAQLVAMKEEVDILMRQSKATLDAAEARYERIEQLSEGGAVPAREQELAREAMVRARAAYEEAQQQLPFLPSEPYGDSLQMGQIVVRSPQAGQITEVFVRPGQFVVQGDALWTISDWSTLWLRVPVFEHDLKRVDPSSPARLMVPGIAEESSVLIQPTGIPQATQDGRRTVDVYYQVPNDNGNLRPGQAMDVALPTDGSAERVLIPRSAILWDGMGNAWVYVEENKNHFRRQRVQLGTSEQEMVVVLDGVLNDQEVVSSGAEVLFGEQFKNQIPALDDDD